mmetsp:Transcript_91966/g.259824  ORF Transcript_91966/g.259824 Transcript_91966/m.259824 type:complete len:294 (-) Transcript_91966:672-1553(-)
MAGSRAPRRCWRRSSWPWRAAATFATVAARESAQVRTEDFRRRTGGLAMPQAPATADASPESTSALSRLHTALAFSVASAASSRHRNASFPKFHWHAECRRALPATPPQAAGSRPALGAPATGAAIIASGGETSSITAASDTGMASTAAAVGTASLPLASTARASTQRGVCVLWCHVQTDDLKRKATGYSEPCRTPADKEASTPFVVLVPSACAGAAAPLRRGATDVVRSTVSATSATAAATTAGAFATTSALAATAAASATVRGTVLRRCHVHTEGLKRYSMPFAAPSAASS